jgi:hypothetical protein
MHWLGLVWSGFADDQSLWNGEAGFGGFLSRRGQEKPSEADLQGVYRVPNGLPLQINDELQIIEHNGETYHTAQPTPSLTHPHWFLIKRLASFSSK